MTTTRPITDALLETILRESPPVYATPMYEETAVLPTLSHPFYEEMSWNWTVVVEPIRINLFHFEYDGHEGIHPCCGLVHYLDLEDNFEIIVHRQDLVHVLGL